jgi:hypothetical protein
MALTNTVTVSDAEELRMVKGYYGCDRIIAALASKKNYKTGSLARFGTDHGYAP